LVLPERLQVQQSLTHLKYVRGKIIFRNESRFGEGKTVDIAAIPGAVIDLQGNNTVQLSGDAAALIGDGDDIVQLLATVDGDGNAAAFGLQGAAVEQGIGPLLVTGFGTQLRIIPG